MAVKTGGGVLTFTSLSNLGEGNSFALRFWES